MTGRFVQNTSVGILLFCLTSGCKRLSRSSDQQAAEAAGAKRTACVSFQGNGVYFSSHVGSLIALLEANFEPVFATGGSSGAILASVSRALVDNPSMVTAGGFDPKKAAVVLAASAPIIESIIFLPRLTTPLALLDSLDVFLTGSSLGVLRADPSDGMVNAESIVGQSAMVVEFYRSSEFSKVLNLKNFSEREKEISRLWKSFVNAIEVTPEQVADAMLIDRETLLRENRAGLVLIQDRIFKMFRSSKDTFLNGYQQSQNIWNSLLRSKGKSFGFSDQERRRSIFRMLLEKIKSLESFDALAATFSGKFMLADPDRVFRSFQGIDARTGRRIEIPSNTIIHSTARKAILKDGAWKEQTGLSSLHQVYFTNSTSSEKIRSILLQSDHNPLKAFQPDARAVIPSERIIVTSQGLSSALAVSTGEPTAFLRNPIILDAPSRSRLGWIDDKNTLVGYG